MPPRQQNPRPYTVAEYELSDSFNPFRLKMMICICALFGGGIMVMAALLASIEPTYEEGSTGGRYYVGPRNHFDNGPYNLKLVFLIAGCVAAGGALGCAAYVYSRLHEARTELQVGMPPARRVALLGNADTVNTPLLNSPGAQFVTVQVPSHIPFYSTGYSLGNGTFATMDDIEMAASAGIAPVTAGNNNGDNSARLSSN